MKKIILFITFSIVGSLANAGEITAGSLNLKCQSQELVGRYPISVELTQLNKSSFDENEQVPFQVSIKTLRPIEQEVMVVPEVYKGILWTEDVHVFFQSSDTSVYLGIYLDELDLSYLRISGGKQIFLTCE